MVSGKMLSDWGASDASSSQALNTPNNSAAATMRQIADILASPVFPWGNPRRPPALGQVRQPPAPGFIHRIPVLWLIWDRSAIENK